MYSQKASKNVWKIGTCTNNTHTYITSSKTNAKRTQKQIISSQLSIQRSTFKDTPSACFQFLRVCYMIWSKKKITTTENVQPQLHDILVHTFSHRLGSWSALAHKYFYWCYASFHLFIHSFIFISVLCWLKRKTEWTTAQHKCSTSKKKKKYHHHRWDSHRATQTRAHPLFIRLVKSL